MEAKKKNLRARKYTSPLIQEVLKSLTDVEKEQSRTRLTIAARIDDFRKARGLTKRGLAEKLNRNPSEMTKWMSGTHNFTNDTLVEIAVALKIDIRDLYKPYQEETKAQSDEICLQSFDLNPIVVLMTPPTSRKHQQTQFHADMLTVSDFLFKGYTTYNA